MFDISKIDKNFKVETNIEKDDIKFYSIEEEPFKIYGIFKENGKFRRMTEGIAKTVSEGVYRLHSNTAGGRVRFITDSPYVAISVKMGELGKMPHFALTGSVGFDMYEDTNYIHTFIPPFDITDGYEGVLEFKSNGEREIYPCGGH